MKIHKLSSGLNLLLTASCFTVSFAAAGAEVSSVIFPPFTPPPPGLRYDVAELAAPATFDFISPLRINNRGDVLGNADASTGPYADEPHAAFVRKGNAIDLHLLVPDHELVRVSLGVDLNHHGQVLFRVENGDPVSRHYVYHNGRLTLFTEVVGRRDLEPLAFNNSGRYVGTARSIDDGGDEAFLYAHGQTRLLGTLPDFSASAASRISDSGQIAGSVRAISGPRPNFRAVVFTPEGILDCGRDFTFSSDINDHGHVTVIGVSFFFPIPAGGFLWRPGEGLTSLSFQPAAVNNADEIVGTGSTDLLGLSEPVLYVDGATYALNQLIESPGWLLLSANDINDQGQIVGLGRFNGRFAGYLLTPRKK
jgi:uncharacterized membrane protein